MEVNRGRFDGVKNILRFNRHFYIWSAMIVLILLILLFFVTKFWQNCIATLVLVFVVQNQISIAASHHIYDRSNLYKMLWLNGKNPKRILSITAGFDETSGWLKKRFPNAEVVVCDFFNPERHTEISLQLARKKYPSQKGTLNVKTCDLPFENESFDLIIGFLSLHEIRLEDERIVMFKEMKRVLKSGENCFITEHLRDPANLFAFNIGVFHFHSLKSWLLVFSESDFNFGKRIKTTSFISTFKLRK